LVFVIFVGVAIEFPNPFLVNNIVFGVYCGQDIIDYTVRPFRVVDDI